jgi:hypothetical protein
MFLLLRRIRQKLMTQNQVTTYLLYALGEIFLVVTGILIAVNIDEWNKSSENSKLVRTYLASLEKELQSNINILEGDIEYSEKNLRIIASITERLSQNSANLDTLMKIARYDYDFNFDPDMSLNNNTFRTLESTGHIALLDSEVRDKLYAHQATQAKEVKIVEANVYYHTRVDSDFHSFYPTSMVESPLGQNMEAAIWKSIDKRDFMFRFNALLTSKKLMEKYLIRQKKTILEETIGLLEYLRNLKKN